MTARTAAIGVRSMIGAMVAALACGPVLAQQEFPAKPISVIVPLAAGGGFDTMARMYTQAIARLSGPKWIFVYDYKPGAGGRLGTAFAAKAAPDGYSIHTNSSTIVYSHLMQGLPFDWRKDFIPLFQMNKTSSILLVNPDLPVRTVADYVAYAKANPGKLNYAVNGMGNVKHITAQFMHSQMDVKVTYIPYKGFGPTTAALLSGEVHATHSAYFPVQGLLKAGKVRPIGLSGLNARLKQLPEMKSISEQGFPDFEHTVWLGMFLPAGVPASIVNRLNSEFNKAARSEDLLKKFDEVGETPGGGTPEEFRRYLATASELLSKVILDNNIQLEE